MADVKLLQPQRLTDNPDGGGLITSQEIVSGEINNLFDDVSRIDRVNGDVSLRAFGVVANTDNVEVYNGLHTIVRVPPQDPRVSAVLFAATNAGGWAGERAEAQAFIERYLDPSIPSTMIPYDTQLANSRGVLVFQRPADPLPTIGEVYVLESEDGATRDYVRVQSFTHFIQERVESQYIYEIRVISMTVTYPLTANYTGSAPTREVERQTGKARMRQTLFADAARYKGCTGLAEDADIGDTVIRLGSVFGQLVPAALSESGFNGDDPAGATVIIPSRDTALVETVAMVPFNPGTFNRYVSRGVVPGSMTITRGGVVWDRADNSRGQIVDLAAGNAVLGTINYATGAMALDNALTATWGTGGGDMQVTYQPAASVSRSAFTAQQPITVGNRGYVYNGTLRPFPIPGTTVVSFLALGRWFDLTDNGAGQLVGADGAGIGQVQYDTGLFEVTLGALPDIGSSVLVAWGGSAETEVLTSEFTAVVPEVPMTLTAGNAEPGTVEITWLAGGIERTATDDGEGNLEGDGTGRIVYGTGQLALRPTLLPDDTSDFTVDYEASTIQTELFNPTKAGSTITMTVAEAPIRPRSLLITYQQTADGPLFDYTTTQQLTDNGAGELVDAAGQIKAGSVVNYTTGEISFNPDFTAVTPVLNYQSFEQRLPARVIDDTTGYWAAIAQFGLWPISPTNVPTSYSFVNGTNVTVQYKEDSATDAAETDEFPPQPLTVDFIPLRANSLVPGGLRFALGTRTYVDRGGTLQHSVSSTTGAATAAGTINYASGVGQVTSWEGGIAPAFTVQALLSEIRPMPVSTVYGRARGAPLRPSSFRIDALRYSDSAPLSAQADTNGNLETANIRGTIDINSGVYAVAFGAWVLDSGLSPEDKAEPWYSAGNVDGDGFIWRPSEVVPGSVKISGVVQVSLPLDPTIIGVNPVRLPPDGRVQIFRPGDTLVFHDTQTEALATPVAGDTEAMTRADLATLQVFDDTGTEVPPGEDTFSVNLGDGALTWADPLDLTGFTGPYTAVHAIEDMALCIDALITGHITINAPLTHGYTSANSLCSSALVQGDVAGRYGQMFAQNTWTNVWSDELIGNPPTSGAQYNDVSFPLVMVNRDAITERWRLQFTSATAFNIVGETLGVIGTGTTSTPVAPINPETDEPYFTMASGGFGTGWATGNLIRFNTYAAGAKVWCARVVQAGPASFVEDRIQIEPRWDKD